MAIENDTGDESQELTRFVRYIQHDLAGSEDAFFGCERVLKRLGAHECLRHFEMIPTTYRLHPDRMPRHPLSRQDYVRIFLACYAAEQISSMSRETAKV